MKLIIMQFSSKYSFPHSAFPLNLATKFHTNWLILPSVNFSPYVFLIVGKKGKGKVVPVLN
jgi:hypothetical protein